MDRHPIVRTVRRIGIGEGHLFRQMRLASLRESPSAFGSTYESALLRTPESWAEQADSTAQGSDRSTFIAFRGDAPIGIAALYRIGEGSDVGELLEVWVSPEQRGKGVGVALMDAVFQWAEVNGFRTVVATVAQENARALRFYRKYGFMPASRSPLGGPDESAVLTKEVKHTQATDAPAPANDRPNHPEEGKFTPFDIWEKGGLTEHLGGIYATRRLLSRCHLAAGQLILDVGCGTGFTACYLAENYPVQVVALDINPRSITEATRRVSRQGAARQVRMVRADAHRLPFLDAVFDTVIVESVLVFCDATAVVAETRRVLKPGSVLGVNEFTFLKSPPARLVSLLADTFGIHTFQKGQWESLLRKAGFGNVTSSVHRISLWEQLVSHLEADGLMNYLTAIISGVKDTSIRGAFFTKEMLAAARDFLPYVGYGVYTGKKLQ